MLPEVVWSMPPMGTFNLHASLLPQYRGAAPINWALINGEKETGVTTFFLKHEIDTGEIIFQEKLAIGEDDNAGTLHDHLMMVGARLVVKTIDAVITGTVPSLPQSELTEGNKELKPAPKNPQRDLPDQLGQARTGDPQLRPRAVALPAAWTEFEVGGEKMNFRIFTTKASPEAHQLRPGEIVYRQQNHPGGCRTGWFLSISLTFSYRGKRRMKTGDFLNGFSF